MGKSRTIKEIIMAEFKSKEITVTTDYDINDNVEFMLDKEKKEGQITAITIDFSGEEMYHVLTDNGYLYSSSCDIEILRKIEE